MTDGSPVAVVLPPDGTSPARARALLRTALDGWPDSAPLDEALLLVTELVTNAVVHAGTALELRVDLEPGGALRVEVQDASPGSSPVVRDAPEAPREGGRGLFLLDALADQWGTTHTRAGKSVWFRLSARAGAGDSAPRASGAVLAQPVDSPAPAALGWLLALPEDLERRLAPHQLLTELLHRLADVLGLAQAVLLAEDPDDTQTWSAVAVRGQQPADGEVAALRRAACAASEPVHRHDGSLLLPVRGRGGVFGAVVLPVAELDPASLPVARLATERLAMVLRDDRAEIAQRRQRGSLALLAEASDMFAATLDVSLAVSLAAQLVVPRFARWAAVYSVEEGSVRLATVAHEDESHAAALRTALTGAEGERLAGDLLRGLQELRPVMVGRDQLRPALGDGAPAGDVLALPLVARSRLLGGLLVARPDGGRYSAEDVSLLLDLARRAALAVANARLYEERTAIAQALQASLLPPELPAPGEVDFGARYVPAGEGNEVGGDFYDVFALPDGGWGVAIGDVCGKGAEAAAITGLARNVLRLLLREGRSPSEALRRLNDAVLELGDRGRFCTAAAAVVHRSREAPGALEVCLSTAGHPPPAVLPVSGPPSFVGRAGTLLGVVATPDLADDDVLLGEGESLVLYTDGVTERRRGDLMFGDDTLLDALHRAAGRTADGLAGALERAVREFAPDASRDDLAVLVVRATGAGRAARLTEG